MLSPKYYRDCADSRPVRWSGVPKLKSRWTDDLCAGLSYTQLLLMEELCLQVWRLECKGDGLVEFKPMHQLKAGGISHKPE